MYVVSRRLQNTGRQASIAISALMIFCLSGLKLFAIASKLLFTAFKKPLVAGRGQGVPDIQAKLNRLFRAATFFSQAVPDQTNEKPKACKSQTYENISIVSSSFRQTIFFFMGFSESAPST